MANDFTNQPNQVNGTRDLFLSYNNRDREAVLRVRQLLREKQLSTFLDRDNLNPGQPWFDELQSAIGQVHAVAVFVGETLGPWQKREMMLALDRQAREEKLGRRFSVIPVVLPKADLDKAPGFLLLNTFVDLRGNLDDPYALEAIVRAARGEAAAKPSEDRPQVELCPYRALRAFREEDAPLFFGREAFAEQLLAKTQQHELIAVIGPSGSGKSSVVQAGLMPLLRRERPPRPTWDAVVFTPGKSPFHSLAAALVATWDVELDLTERLLKAERLGNSLAGGEVRLEAAIQLALEASEGTDRLLVVVDQFEELFTLTEEKDRKPFVEALLSTSALAPVTIALTLRADFYSQAIGLHRELSDRIQQGLVNLGPMTRDELCRAIEKPAYSVGLKFDPGLVERILDNVEDQPGNLPLLEFALTELWGKKQGRDLTHNQYDKIGQVEGAIGQRAEQLFGSLKPDEQRVVLRAFTRLVRVSAGGEEGADTRQRAKLSDLEPQARSPLQEFVKARLLITDLNEPTNEETIEVAHEALIRRWDRLKEMLNEDRRFLLWRQRLGIALGEWQRIGRDAGALLRSVSLDEAQRWRKERGQDLNDREQEFIAHSESAEKQPKYWIAAAIAFITMVALVWSGWKLWDNRPQSQINKILAQSPKVLKAAVVGDDVESVSTWLSTLVLTGRLNEALDAARKIEGAEPRSLALASVIISLTKDGQTAKAKQVATEELGAARKIKDTNISSGALAIVVEALAKADLTAEALEVAREIEDADSRFLALASIVTALAKVGPTAEAKQAATEALGAARMFSRYLPSWQRDALVEALAKAGQIAEALEVARTIQERVTLSETLAILVEILAKDGRTTEAKKIATEALNAAREIENAGFRSQALASIVMALAKASQTTEAKQIAIEALDAARRAEDGSGSQRLATLVEALAKADQTVEALGVARRIEVAEPRSLALASIVTTLAKAGQAAEAKEAVAEALDAAQKVGNADIRYRTLARIAEFWAKTSQTTEALNAALKIEHNAHRSRALVQVVKALAKVGKTEEALEVARKIESAFSRSQALVSAAEVLDKRREATDRARIAIAEAQQIAEQIINEDEKSAALGDVATGLAKLYLYRQARELVDNNNTSAKDKITAYTAILREYHIERYPDQAKLFEGEKQE